MSEIVRIMPKEPIEAVPMEWTNMFGGYDTMYLAGSDVGVFRDFDGAEYCEGRAWVEVTEYTWDGSDEAIEAIRAALGDPYHVAATGIANDLWILDGRDPHFEVRASFGARIRIEGDSFAVLPPEVK